MKYTTSHEWIDVKEKGSPVGITAHAQKELGEIVYIELPQVGKSVEAGEEIAVLESTKAAADIYTPVSGKIVAVNEALAHDLTLLNNDPEGEGWLFTIEPSNICENETLLSKDEYLAILS